MAERLEHVEGERGLGEMRWCLIVLLAVGIGWRVLRFLVGMPIWGDEAFVGLNLMDRGFGDLLKPLEYSQVAPALFVIGEWVMQRVMGASEYSLRILPTVAGILALLVFASWARKVVSARAALFATGILAVAFYPVRHSVEVKPYAFDLLASCVMLWVATVWLQRPERVRWLWVLGVVMGVAIFASYPAVFVAGGILLTILPMVVRGKNGGAWVGYMFAGAMLLGAVAVSYVYVVLPQQQATQASMNAYWQKAFLPLSILPAMKWLAVEHVGNLMAYPVGGKNGASTLTFLFFVAGVWTMWKGESCGTQGKRKMLGILLLPFLLTLMASAMQKYPYGDSARITQHLAPMICLLNGLGVAAIVEMVFAKQLTAATVAVVGIYVVIGLVGATVDVVRPYKRLADWETRAVVEKVVRQNDQVAVVQAMKKVPVNFQWYLRKERPGLSYGGEGMELSPEKELAVFNFVQGVRVEDGLGAGRELVRRDVYALKTGPEEEPPVYCEVTRWGVRRGAASAAGQKVP